MDVETVAPQPSRWRVPLTVIACLALLSVVVFLIALSSLRGHVSRVATGLELPPAGMVIHTQLDEGTQHAVGTLFATTSPSEVDGEWLVCDGRTVSSAEYPELFGVIGDTFTGDAAVPAGSFRLPDYRGMVTPLPLPAGTFDNLRVGSAADSREHAEGLLPRVTWFIRAR